MLTEGLHMKGGMAHHEGVALPRVHEELHAAAALLDLVHILLHGLRPGVYKCKQTAGCNMLAPCLQHPAQQQSRRGGDTENLSFSRNYT